MSQLLLLGVLLCESPAFPVADADLGKALNEQKSVFLDTKGSRLWLKTHVARDTGLLEMFLCRTGTKEHESVVAIDSPAFTIHAGLLALGLEPGTPAQFDGKFVPPKGPELAITVHWTDSEGKKQSRPAAEWMRQVTQRWFIVECSEDLAAGVSFPKELDFRYIAEDNELLWFGPMTDENANTLKALSEKPAWASKIDELQKATQVDGFHEKWVFAGSGFWVDEETGDRRYLAESGNLVCVANFGDAMIDVATNSSSENASLLFEPWTGRVPAPGTPVLVEIRKASQR